MIIGDAHQGTAAGLAQSRREPLWAIGLSAVLVATRFGRRPANPHSGGGVVPSWTLGAAGLRTAIGDPGAGMEGRPFASL
jgi:hypothetical protein